MIKKRLILAGCLLAIITYVILLGYQFGAWTGFPKGIDVYSRISRIVYLLDFFPHIDWLYQWSNGMPNFKTEGPLFYFLGAIISQLPSLSVEKSLIVIGFFTYVLIGVGLFGYVYSLTKNLMAGLLTAVLGLSSYSVWEWMIYGGVYPRIFGLALSLLAVWQFIRLLRMVKGDQALPKWPFLGAVLCLAAAMVTHALMAFYAWVNIFLILVFIPLPRKLKIKVGFWVYLTAFSLTGFFFLPLVLGFSSGVSRLLGADYVQAPIPLYHLFSFDGIGPFILPLLTLSFISVFFLLKLHPLKKSVFWRLLLPSLLMFAYFAAYGLVGYTGLPGKYYTVLGFIPLSASLFIAIYGSILIGLIIGRWGKFSRKVGLVSLALIILVALSFPTAGVSLIKENRFGINIWDTSSRGPENGIYALQQIIKFPEEDLNHRFSATDASEAMWFNAFYKIPQVRDYYAQGVLYPHWRSWHEQTLWNVKEFSLDEAKMSLDWLAIRWFSNTEYFEELLGEYRKEYRLVQSADEFLAHSQTRYLNQPGFKLVAYGRYMVNSLHEQFEVENPSPILSATNSPPILFIGDKESYSLLFRGLSLVNLNSQKLISVLGKQFIDDYQLAELESFKTIFLYNYRYHQKGKAYKLLQEYVHQGGNLIWEVAGSPDFEGELPEPAPATQVSQKELKENWNFKAAGGILTSGINFSLFSPLVYNDGFWKLSAASTASLRPWAKGVLGKGEEWVALSGDYGEGKIIWTGFNFPYHLNANKNYEEAKLLARMINGLGEEEIRTVDYKAEFINPEKRSVEIREPAKGVLFKESYYPNWHAFLIENNGQKRELRVRQAGPAMMYSLLPKEIELPATVTFEYRTSLIEKLGYIISILTLISLLFYLFLGRSPIPSSYSRNISSWWDKEEE